MKPEDVKLWSGLIEDFESIEIDKNDQMVVQTTHCPIETVRLLQDRLRTRKPVWIRHPSIGTLHAIVTKLLILSGHPVDEKSSSVEVTFIRCDYVSGPKPVVRL